MEIPELEFIWEIIESNPNQTTTEIIRREQAAIEMLLVVLARIIFIIPKIANTVWRLSRNFYQVF